jgi:hypothetical protein
MPRHPLNEGSIADIFRHFFGPLVRYKHEEQSLGQFMGELFGLNERTITRYKVKKPFKIPGLFATAPHRKIQGIGERNVKRGDILWVRTDITKPNSIDVQWLKPGQDLVFELNEREFNWIRLNLESREDKTHARR